MPKPTPEELNSMFAELKAIMMKYSKGLVIQTGANTVIKVGDKSAFGLIGAKDVAIGNRKPQPTYVCGLIQQKNFVGFYSMPIYSHPKEIPILDKDVAKMKKGKSCINVTHLTPAIKKELDRIVKEGIRVYKKEKWI